MTVVSRTYFQEVFDAEFKADYAGKEPRPMSID